MFSRFRPSSWRWLNTENGYGTARAEMIYIESRMNDVRLGKPEWVPTYRRSCQRFKLVSRLRSPPYGSQVRRCVVLCGSAEEREDEERIHQWIARRSSFSRRPIEFELRTLENHPRTMNLLPFIYFQTRRSISRSRGGHKKGTRSSFWP